VSEPLRFLRHALDNATAYFASLASRQFSIPDIHDQPVDNGLLGLFLTIPALIGAWTLKEGHLGPRLGGAAAVLAGVIALKL